MWYKLPDGVGFALYTSSLMHIGWLCYYFDGAHRHEKKNGRKWYFLYIEISECDK